MSATLTEDDIYRTSSQYRLWSFSPEQLSGQRRKTHELALARAKQYLTLSQQNGNESNNGASIANCLTADEELRLVQKYCDTIHATGKHLDWPTNIPTTAIQYLKRFYLSNSCMTYPPKEIYKTILFLASKTEAYHLTLSQFCRLINAEPDAVLAPEYKVMQALRFTLDVRQPYRGLKGALMELLNMVDGLVDRVSVRDGKEVQQGLLTLKAPEAGDRTQWKAPADVQKKQAVERVQLAYAAAKHLLETAASLTDAYFLYTPSQILIGALRVADAPLLDYYMDTKLPVSLPTRPKILATIHDCAALLTSHNPKNSISKDERAALERKLETCRDPATKDLIAVHAAVKQNGAGDDEEKANRKKLDREKNKQEMDNLFGPSLGAPKAGG